MWQRAIETASLFALIVVTALRPLIGESYDPAGSPLTAALSGVSDPSPLRTLVFDVVIMLAVAGWLTARALGPPRRYRRTGLEWGAGLVVIAALVSCLVAGNKRLAINASIDWLCYPLLTIALVQLMHRPWQRRLVLAAVLASACAQSTQCFEQYFVGFDETWEHYQSIKEGFWARQGVDAGSAKIETFERRMRAREATGFMPHGSITGSYLVLCGMAAVGIAMARWRRAVDAARWPLFMASSAAAAFIVAAALLTKSLGAVIAGIVGIVLWLVVSVLRPWIDVHRRKAFFIGWIAVACGAVCVVGYGLRHDRLPGWSLTFRWQYWQASSELIADHALTGVGRENFGRHYLQYKSIESPEEVANPHNLFVQAAADWGLLGLIGVVTMLIGGSRAVCFRSRGCIDVRATLPAQDPRIAIRGRRAGGSSGRPTVIAWVVAIMVATIGIRVLLIRTDDPNFFYYAYYTSVTLGLSLLIGFAIFGIGWDKEASQPDPSTGLVGAGIAIGLFTFVLHDMINFATFIPATATTFFALLAVSIAQRFAEEPTIQPCGARRRWLPPMALFAGIAVVAWTAVVPVARAGLFLKRARLAGRELVPAPVIGQVAYDYFQRAAQADPFDPTPYVERTRWLMAASTVPLLRDEALRLAVSSLDEAVKRDPLGSRLHRLRMQVFKTRAEATGSVEDRRAAIEAARRALELYPQDPAGIASLADRLLEAGEAASSDQLLEQAVATFERALKLDGERLSWEELHRFREKERRAIQSKIEHARRILHGLR